MERTADRGSQWKQTSGFPGKGASRLFFHVPQWHYMATACLTLKFYDSDYERFSASLIFLWEGLTLPATVLPQLFKNRLFWSVGCRQSKETLWAFLPARGTRTIINIPQSVISGNRWTKLFRNKVPGKQSAIGAGVPFCRCYPGWVQHCWVLNK